MLVRVIAAALVGWTVVELALYWVVRSHNQQPLEVLPCVIKSLPAVVGLVFFVRARAIADWISDKLDL